MPVANELHIAAALAENVYRRDADDQSIKIAEDIGGEQLDLGSQIADGTLKNNANYYYNDTTGFVGSVTEANGKIYVTYRGTDNSGGFTDIFKSLAKEYLGLGSGSSLSDPKDFSEGNAKLSAGTTSRSQLDDALALYDAAVVASGGKEVVVVGQSLGGGLAGLVSAIREARGIAISPAPFANQLAVEATFAALAALDDPIARASILDYISIGGQAVSASRAFVAGGDLLRIFLTDADLENPNFLLSSEEIETIIACRDAKLAIYQSHMAMSLSVHTITGEALTSGSIGDLTPGSQFNAPVNHYDVGHTASSVNITESVRLHGAAIHNLIIRTATETDKFADLLKNDPVLRHVLLNTEAGTPLEHDRADPGGPSKQSAGGANPAILFNALWKTVGGERDLYEYFHELFNKTMKAGIAGTPQEASEQGLHSGLVKLALGVLRDALQDTADIAALKAKLGGSWDFAGAEESGVPYTDHVVIDRTRITAQDPSLKENGLDFGVGDINREVYRAFFDSATLSGMPNGAIAALGQKLFGPLYRPSEGAVDFSQKWQIVVAQAGSNDGGLSYVPDATKSTKSGASYSDAAHAIFGGKGSANNLTGSSKGDYVLGGDKNDKLIGREGNDLLIGGKGEDELRGDEGDDIILGDKGNDELRGGEGSDTYIGGDGADRFFLEVRDRIMDSSATDKLFLNDELIQSVEIRNVFGEYQDFPFTDYLRGYNVFYYGYVSANSPIDRRGFPTSAIFINSGTNLYIFSPDGTVNVCQDYQLGDFGINVAAGMDFATQARQDFDDRYSNPNIEYELRLAPYMRYLAQAKAFDAQLKLGRSPSEFLFLTGELRTFHDKMFSYEFIPAEMDSHDANTTTTFAQAVSRQAQTFDQQQMSGPGETFIGTNSFDLLEGTNNDDVFHGGGGMDLLIGGEGSDAYIYGNGEEAYYISESSDDSSSVDFVDLTAFDINKFEIYKSGSDLIISMIAYDENGNTQSVRFRSITVFNQFTSGEGTGVEEIRFAGDVVWDRAQIVTHVGFDDGSANQAPIDITLDTNSVDEHLFDEGFVGTLSGVDPDGSDGLHYSVVGADSKNFTITDDRLWFVGGPNALDYEAETSRNITIRVTDKFGAFYEKEIAISVSNIADISGTSSDDALIGTAANDIVVGGNGRDSLEGGAGDDLLLGGLGGDIYRVDSSSGHDTIVEVSEVGAVDRIAFAAGIEPGQVSVTREGGTARLTWGTGNSLTIAGQFGEAGAIEEIIFSGSPVWTADKLKEIYLLQAATRDAEDIVGFQSDDVISSGVGNDSIDGGAGADVLDGGAGDDILDGGMGDDTLDGGIGNDLLIGDIGSDVFVFGSNSGRDVIKDFGFGEASDDVARFRDGIFGSFAAVMAAAQQVGNDTVITINAESQITLKNVRRAELVEEDFEFVGGEPGPTDDATIIGTAAAETIDGTGVEDVIFGKEGDDAISGSSGGDVYIYRSGDGNDTIDDLAGYTDNVDVLRFTNLNASNIALARIGDALKITVAPTGEVITIAHQFYSATENWGIERFDFAAGTSWDLATINANAAVDPTGDATIIGTSAAETVTGTAIEDIIFAKEGNDEVIGGAGGDVFIYRSADGSDKIADGAGYTDNVDVIRFTDLNAADISLTRAGEALKIKIAATGQTITVDRQFYSATENWGIERFDFANGTSWDLATINANAVVDPTGDASILGTSAAETVAGTGVEDIIFAKEGDDEIAGGAGGDVYIYRSGDGSDTIADGAGYTDNVDVIRFTNLNATDISLTRAGEALKIKIIATGETITVDRQFHSTEENWGIERFDFANGTSWDLATINSNAIVDPTGDATVIGTSVAETVTGTGIEDIIFAKEGDDLIIGGAGGDVFIYRSGDGSDTIADGAGYTNNVDVIRFIDLNAGDISLTRAGNALKITTIATGQTITVDLHFYSTIENWGIERFDFADGTNWNQVTINANAVVDPDGGPTLIGTSGNDILVGTIGTDVILGDAGDDDLTGGGGSDVFVFASSFGKDVIADFVAGAGSADLIEFDDAVFADLSAVLAAAAQVGADTLITYDVDNTITLKNVTKANLHADDFRFV